MADAAPGFPSDSLPNTRSWASIDLSALIHNFGVARQQNTACAIVAVVKSNAYGHGVEPVARALDRVMRTGDCFGVASLEEGLQLHALGLQHPVLLLEGVVTLAELDCAMQAGFQLVIHSAYQLQVLQTWLTSQPEQGAGRLVLWLKLDTGMHRLGMDEQTFIEVLAQVRKLPAVDSCVLMSHLACADDMLAPATQRQINHFKRMVSQHVTASPDGKVYPCSMAASGGTLAWPQSHFDYLRPGIMLYGGTAIMNENGLDRGLLPVMSLRARLIAISTVKAGEAIGYGATYVCPRDLRVGVVSIGYGDGYPRHAPNGTPVLVKLANGLVGQTRRTRLVGRVSMDMLTIDLSDMQEAVIGDEVILWGEGLPADEIARLCGTIAYELFCQVTRRVSFVYRNMPAE